MDILPKVRSFSGPSQPYPHLLGITRLLLLLYFHVVDVYKHLCSGQCILGLIKERSNGQTALYSESNEDGGGRGVTMEKGGGNEMVVAEWVGL